MVTHFSEALEQASSMADQTQQLSDECVICLTTTSADTRDVSWCCCKSSRCLQLWNSSLTIISSDAL